MAESVGVERTGDLVSAIGSPEFGHQYFSLFSGVLPIDQCTVFAFKGSARPGAVVLEAKSAAMRGMAQALASEYVAGSFEHDPNFNRERCAQRPAVYCMRADEVHNRTYRLRFYDEPQLAHELVVLGQTADTLYISSFYRSDRRAGFCRSEIDTMQNAATFAIKTLHRHLALTSGAAAGQDCNAQRNHLLAHLRQVLLDDPCMLSPREAEVCAGIILGYTPLGISLNFGITISTVATHRKRAYRKLRICSQNELFSRYFQVVDQFRARPAPTDTPRSWAAVA